jgi:PAS domain-containing protein
MASPLRILHVDDNPFDRAVVLGVLSQELDDAFVHQVADPEGRIRRANDAFAKRAGLTPAALVGRRCDEVLDWWNGPSGQSALARCLASGRPITEEREVIRTGEMFVQTCSPFLDARGTRHG